MAARARRLVALGAALLGLAAGAPLARAASSYCSPTGDYCVGAKPAGRGDALLQVAGFPFRGRYRLCVTPPGGGRTCRTFRLRERRGLYSSSVRWSLHFPDRGRGVYRARWTVSLDPDDPPSTRLRGLAFRR